jgi:hypothetical protein
VKRFFLLQSVIGSLLCAHLPAEIHQESPIDGYVIQYDAAIASSKVWISWDGKEHVRLFTLSDGTRWITTSEEAFHTVTKSRWRAGDHLTITLTQNAWEAENRERSSSVSLQQLCNKGADN